MMFCAEALLRKSFRGPPKAMTFRAPVSVLVMVPPEMKPPDMVTGPVAEVRARYFGQNRPASTLVQISQLASPDYKVEIEAIAVAP